MTLVQLWGKYLRLELEVATVSSRSPLHEERLTRLAADICSTRRELADSRKTDEHCDDLGALGGGLAFWDGGPESMATTV